MGLVVIHPPPNRSEHQHHSPAYFHRSEHQHHSSAYFNGSEQQQHSSAYLNGSEHQHRLHDHGCCRDRRYAVARELCRGPAERCYGQHRRPSGRLYS